MSTKHTVTTKEGRDYTVRSDGTLKESSTRGVTENIVDQTLVQPLESGLRTVIDAVTSSGSKSSK